MGKNYRNSHPSQGSYAGSSQGQQQASKQSCSTQQAGSSASSCMSEPRRGQAGQKPQQSRDASLRTNPSEKEAAANEDWEGGASRPAQEAQAPAVKKNVPAEMTEKKRNK